MRLVVLSALVAAAALGPVTTAAADSTPIGPLPKGPVTTVTASRGSLVAIALPRQPASSGLVWRLARPVRASVARQASEADVGNAVVVVYRLVGHGRATIVYALTRGDASPKALRSATYAVRVA